MMSKLHWIKTHGHDNDDYAPEYWYETNHEYYIMALENHSKYHVYVNLEFTNNLEFNTLKEAKQWCLEHSKGADDES